MLCYIGDVIVKKNFGNLLLVYCSKLLFAFNNFYSFPRCSFLFYSFFFSFSSSLSPVALSNQSSFLQSSPLSRSNQTHSLSHLRSNSHHVFVGLFKVDHVVSLFVAVTTWVKLCWSQWWWVNLWRWWWVVMGVVGCGS